MPTTEQNVKRQTLYISIAVSLIMGFLGGIVYSVYNTPGIQPQPSPQQTSEQFAQTITSLEEETKDHPDNVEAWTQLGHAYFDSDQYTKAIYAYNKSLQILPGNPDVLTDLGVMYRRNKQPQKALESFDKALQLNPRHEQATFNKGVVFLYDLHDTARAIQAWKTLLQINPSATAPNSKPIAELVQQLEQQTDSQKSK